MQTPEEKRAKRAAYMREWSKKNPERSKAIKRKSNNKRRKEGYVWSGQLQSKRDWHKKNKEHAANYQKARNREISRAAFDAYGGCCVCCGESDQLFLTIDHVNGGGSKHRKEVLGGRRAGVHFYRWLMKEGYPQTGEYQTMCYNCNLGRQRNGGICPHKQV